MPARTLRLSAALVIASALLAGCSATSSVVSEAPIASASASIPLAELDLLEDPRAYEGPSTAVLADAAIEPIESTEVAQLPTTVTSHDLDGDTQVTVESTERVLGVDISGSIAATIWGLGLGDTLVGRDVSTTFPGTEDLPLVTSSGHSVNSEAILALRPTLIITDGTVGPTDVLLQLREAGIAVVFVDTESSTEGVEELAHQVSAALGVPATGELLAERLRSEIDAKVAEIAAIAPVAEEDKLRILFLYLRGGSGIYYLFGEESGADELAEGLGGIDVAGQIGWEGMRPMTDEAMIAANPDLILVMTDGIESAGGVDGLLETKPAIALTLAGQHRRFVDMADGEILSFGPRTPAVLDALARAVYAPEA
jgi:iron complex transport system substrate-binding protein